VISLCQAAAVTISFHQFAPTDCLESTVCSKKVKFEYPYLSAVWRLVGTTSCSLHEFVNRNFAS
jgi:hypothetical protein